MKHTTVIFLCGLVAAAALSFEKRIASANCCAQSAGNSQSANCKCPDPAGTCHPNSSYLAITSYLQNTCPCQVYVSASWSCGSPNNVSANLYTRRLTGCQSPGQSLCLVTGCNTADGRCTGVSWYGTSLLAKNPRCACPCTDFEVYIELDQDCGTCTWANFVRYQAVACTGSGCNCTDC